MVYQGKKDWQNAKNDLENVLKREPGNKRAIVSTKNLRETVFYEYLSTKMSEHFYQVKSWIEFKT